MLRRVCNDSVCVRTSAQGLREKREHVACVRIADEGEPDRLWLARSWDEGDGEAGIQEAARSRLRGGVVVVAFPVSVEGVE